MSKMLRPGECRQIVPKGSSWNSKNQSFEIFAHCEDQDTPIVELRIDDTTLYMEDGTTQRLIDCLQRALDILPSSK